MVRERDNIVGLDSAILMNRDVWHTSGHVESFADPLVECKNCHARFRSDLFPKEVSDKQFEGKWLVSYKSYHGVVEETELKAASRALKESKEKGSVKCPSCGEFKGYTEPKMFNLMFKTQVGPVEDEASTTFLRPETAQGIFVNFGNVIDTMRVKLPFGIAQIGKGFRNEITIGNFLFRVREFEMMELEYFTYPDKAEKDFEYWQKERMDWHLSLGLKKENLRFREHKDDERAHYATRSVDIEYDWPFMGWGELEGIANRTDFDLKEHSKASGKDLSYFDEKTKKKIIPFVIEPSLGIGRLALALLVNAYTEETLPAGRQEAPTVEKGEKEIRVVLKLSPGLAPVKVAVLPLVKDTRLIKIAKEIYKDLRKEWNVMYDEVATIGRRYRRQDEIGTPFAITVDFDTLKDNSVTIRDRDSMKQERVNIKELNNKFDRKIE